MTEVSTDATLDFSWPGRSVRRRQSVGVTLQRRSIRCLDGQVGERLDGGISKDSGYSLPFTGCIPVITEADFDPGSEFEIDPARAIAGCCN